MTKITKADLRQRILALEIRVAEDREAIKDGFRELHQSMTLSHIIKKTAHDLSSSAGFKNDLLTLVMSFGAGLVSKKMVAGSSTGVIRNLFGKLVQAGVTKLVSSNADGIKSVGLNLLKSFFSKKEKEEEEPAI